MTRPRRAERPLRRHRPQKPQLPRYVIFCEGEITEPQYLAAFARLPTVRAIATLDVRGMGYDPRRLVEECKEQKRQDRAKGPDPTQYWCVFDVEAPTQHARLLEATQMASANDIRVAVSNPCFELWLLLHHEDHRKWVDNDQCRAQLRKHDASRGRGLDGNAYMQLLSEALKRAKQLEAMHEHAGRELPSNNPSSGMNLLLQAINPNAHHRVRL